MAKNWTAYEAAKELYGTDVQAITEIGSRFPVFTRTVSMENSEYLLDILKAIPKVTARMVETGLRGAEAEEPETEEEAKDEPKKTEKAKKAEPKEEPETEEPEETEYDSMTTKALYKLCCERGISSQCKKRDKASLIKVLKANEGKAEESEETEDDSWDEEPEEPKKDPYAGKKARELFNMCKDRGIKAEQRKPADYYVKLLKKADEAEAEEPETDNEDDEWDI